MSNELAKALKRKPEDMIRLQGQTQKAVVIEDSGGNYYAPEQADYSQALAEGKNIQILVSGNTKTIHAIMNLVAGDNVSISDPDEVTGAVTITVSDPEISQATDTVLGGIRANAKTTQTSEVFIDSETGKLYTAAPDAAANGLPSGGTAGQIPSKIDATDYNVQWVDPPSGGGGNAIDVPPLVPSSWDDEFNDGAIDVKWAWANQGSATAVESGGKVAIKPRGDAMWCGLVQALPAGNWEITAKMSWGGDYIADSYAGIFLLPATDGKIIGLALGKDSTANSIIRGEAWNAWATYASQILAYNYPVNTIYLKIRWDGTNLHYHQSCDGVAFAKLKIAAPGFVLGRFGIGARGNALPSYFDWVRLVQL